MVNKSSMLKDCQPCKRSFHRAKHKKHISLFGSIFLAFLPKCPFCFMAFTNTLILCGEGHNLTSERTFTSSTTFILTLIFCFITLLSIIFNYRDSRTKYAIALALTGSVLVILSVSITGGLLLYYFGVVFIFAGVWLNASLLYFVRKIREYLDAGSEKQVFNNG